MKKSYVSLLILLLVICLSIPMLASCDTLSNILDELETFEYDSDNMGGGYQPPSWPGGDDMFDPDSSYTPDPPQTDESYTEDNGVPAETLPIETDENESVETSAPTDESSRDPIHDDETVAPGSTDDNEHVSSVEPAPEQTERPNEPELETKFYDDYFYLSIVNDSNPIDYYRYDSSASSSVVDEALYARQMSIYEKIGVEIVVTNAGNADNYTVPFMTAIKNLDGSVDTLLSHSDSGVSKLVAENYLKEFGNLPGIDLSKSYWNLDVMDQLAIPVDEEYHYFLGYSDFNLPNTHVIVYNKELADIYMPFSGENVYETVRSGMWTFEEMYLAAKSFNSGDLYGLTGQQWTPWIGWLQASDVEIVELSWSNEMSIFIDDSRMQKTLDLVDRLQALVNDPSTYFDVPVKEVVPPCSIPLSSGRTFMQLENTYNVKNNLDCGIDFGILPYPKYEMDQAEYRSLQWGGYICIPGYLRNAEMTGDTLNLLAEYSDGITLAFFEEMLGKPLSEAPDDADMLEIVKESICSDFGQAYSDVCPELLYAIPYATIPGENGIVLTQQFSAATLKMIERRLHTYIKSVQDDIPSTPGDGSDDSTHPEDYFPPVTDETDRIPDTPPEEVPDYGYETEECDGSVY